jgi:hypothetical protein
MADDLEAPEGSSYAELDKSFEPFELLAFARIPSFQLAQKRSMSVTLSWSMWTYPRA